MAACVRAGVRAAVIGGYGGTVVNGREQRLTQELIVAAALCVGEDVEIIRGDSRKARPALARQAVYYVLRKDHGWTLVEIAEALGREHSTVSKGASRFERLIHSDEDALELLLALRQVSANSDARADVEAAHAMAVTLLSLTVASRKAIDSLELVARQALRVTEAIR